MYAIARGGRVVTTEPETGRAEALSDANEARAPGAVSCAQSRAQSHQAAA